MRFIRRELLQPDSIGYRSGTGEFDGCAGEQLEDSQWIPLSACDPLIDLACLYPLGGGYREQCG